jgi:hypothetical protein
MVLRMYPRRHRLIHRTNQTMRLRDMYELTLTPTPNHPWKPEQRLKRLLKIAGRVLGLRCTSCKEAGKVKTADRQSDATEGQLGGKA